MSKPNPPKSRPPKPAGPPKSAPPKPSASTSASSRPSAPTSAKTAAKSPAKSASANQAKIILGVIGAGLLALIAGLIMALPSRNKTEDTAGPAAVVAKSDAPPAANAGNPSERVSSPSPSSNPGGEVLIDFDQIDDSEIKQFSDHDKDVTFGNVIVTKGFRFQGTKPDAPSADWRGALGGMVFDRLDGGPKIRTLRFLNQQTALAITAEDGKAFDFMSFDLGRNQYTWRSPVTAEIRGYRNGEMVETATAELKETETSMETSYAKVNLNWDQVDRVVIDFRSENEDAKAGIMNEFRFRQ